MIKILVTGSHRSGTTWVGKMLTIDKKNIYIHEPNNFDDNIKFNKYNTNYWFEYLQKEQIFELNKDFKKLKYPLFINLKRSKSFKDLLKSSYYFLKYLVLKLRGDYNVIIKDPISIFNIQNYLDCGFKIVLTQRNPFSFISSLYVKGWNFDFNHILSQEKLMLAFPQEIQNQIKSYSNSNNTPIIDQGILLWNMFMTYINKLDHEKLIIINHEDLSFNPIGGFKELYNRLGLSFNQDIERIIHKTTMISKVPKNEKSNDLIRNSKKNLYSFKRRLNETQIKHMFQATKMYMTPTYKGFIMDTFKIKEIL